MVQMRNAEKILRRLDWTVVRRLDGLLQGDYRTLFHGSGMDLAELREYQLTDDVRSIDWNVTARMQTPYVRQYLEDRDITAWFLLDLSPSMDFGTVETIKRNMLIDFVAVMARLLTRNGNRVGGILYDGKVDGLIPALSGRHHVLRLMDSIINHPCLKKAPATDLSPLLETGLRVIKRRSVIFIISDFISTAGWEKPLGVMARRHDIMAVRLYDPREIQLPDLGVIIMEDAESGEQMLVDTHDQKFRKRFVEAGVRRQQQIESAFARAGVDIMELSTEDDLANSLVRQSKLRKQRRKSVNAMASRP